MFNELLNLIICLSAYHLRVTTIMTTTFSTIIDRIFGLMSRVFVNGPGDQDYIPGLVIPKTQKMVLDATLLNTQHYKVTIKGKVDESREWSCALLLHHSLEAIEKGAFGSPSTKFANNW